MPARTPNPSNRALQPGPFPPASVYPETPLDGIREDGSEELAVAAPTLSM